MKWILEHIGSISQAIVSFITVGIFAVVIFILMFKPVDLPSGVKEVLLVLTGVLAGAFKDVTGYYVGSSLGSQRLRDALMEKKHDPAP